MDLDIAIPVLYIAFLIHPLTPVCYFDSCTVCCNDDIAIIIIIIHLDMVIIDIYIQPADFFADMTITWTIGNAFSYGFDYSFCLSVYKVDEMSNVVIQLPG
jgi:hypothetical protein